jgi:hypothetical protein
MNPMSIAPELQVSVNSPVVATTTISTGTPSVFASALPGSRAEILFKHLGVH